MSALRTLFSLAISFIVIVADASVIQARPVESPDTGAFSPGQAAADAMRNYAKTDGAFIAADQLKTTYSKDNLASLLQYPADSLVVLSLSGSQLKEAFERSLSLYPQANPSFLQLSGFEVAFNKDASPNSRVVRVTVNGSPLDQKHSYTVAMPLMLGNGILGYFKIWDKSQITKPSDTTIEHVLTGKPYVASSPRWLLQ